MNPHRQHLTHLYKNIRDHVDAERHLKYKFLTGQSVRDCADPLGREIAQRGLAPKLIQFSANKSYLPGAFRV